jgi:hypothetical protein
MRLIKFLWQSESLEVPIPALETIHGARIYIQEQCGPELTLGC